MFVVIIFMSSKYLRSKPVNLFLINQSFLDMVATLIMVLHFNLDLKWDFLHPSLQHVLCNVWNNALCYVLVFCASGYNLVALSYERFLAITKPFEYDAEKVGSYIHL